jgi:arginine:agmatine antiporter
MTVQATPVRGDDARQLGPLSAGFLVASNMIGSGVFLLPATLAAIGSISLFGWLITTVGALALALVFAGLAQARPHAPGLAGYVRDGLGDFVGFVSAIFYWVTAWTGNVAIALAVTGYLAHFLPGVQSGWPAAWATVGVILLFTALNLVGAKAVARFSGLTTIVGLLPLAVVGIAGWWWFDSGLWREAWNLTGKPPAEAVQASFAQIFWAFLGVESAAVAAAVVRNPARNVPLATVGGVLVAAAVYISACTAIMGLIPAAELAKSSAPFADAVRRILGPAFAGLVAVCALLKTSGTLNGWVLVTAETAESSAEAGLFPGFFARGGRAAAPRRNLLIAAGLMSAVTLGTVAPHIGEQFKTVINIAVVLSLFVFAFASVALILLARKFPPGRAVFFVLASLVGLGFCAWVIAQSDAKTWSFVALTAAIAAGLYAARLVSRTRSPVGD